MFAQCFVSTSFLWQLFEKAQFGWLTSLTNKNFLVSQASFSGYIMKASFAGHYLTSSPSYLLGIILKVCQVQLWGSIHPRNTFTHFSGGCILMHLRRATQQTISMLRILHVRWCTLHIAPCCIYTLYAQYDVCVLIQWNHCHGKHNVDNADAYFELLYPPFLEHPIPRKVF